MTTEEIRELGKIEAIHFADWLMTNCELLKDQTIWSYDSEDYTLEGIYKVFNELQKV